MNNYFDADGNLKFERFLFLNGIHRAILDGWGVDDLGYIYDIVHKNDEFIGIIHHNKGFRKEKTFSRKLTAKIWLTTFYKDHNG